MTDRLWRRLLVLGLVLVSCGPTRAAQLDSNGELRFRLRSYTLARVGSESFDFTDNEDVVQGSFPASAAGHVRQLRAFVEVGLDHDLDRLMNEGFGPLSLLRQLPFRITGLSYNLVFRGEYDGVYDFGPAEFSTAAANRKTSNPLGGGTPSPETVAKQRRHLRELAVHRERLFQAYIEGSAGDLFVRFGRQILVWGETDVFRLLDNINPTDSSFGGFLIPLDERRVPLDMLRLNYTIGSLGPFSDLFVEGYAAVDNQVSYYPEIPAGSPWAPPLIGYPNGVIFPVFHLPARSLSKPRGGAQVKSNITVPALGSVTLGLAHYYTHVDLPGVQNSVRVALSPFPGTDGAILKADLTAPTVQVTGLSGSFVIPARFVREVGLSGEPVIRTELAYLHDEPRYSQFQLDPFAFRRTLECRTAGGDGICSGGRRLGDSWNFVLGIDHNQYIRLLNPTQSILFSTQFFYKHLLGAVQRQVIPGTRGIVDGEVLPVFQYIDKKNPRLPFVRNPIDQYIQTLVMTTSYYGGQVSPTVVLVYDWSGAFSTVPMVTLSRDPFRFAIGYAAIEASKLKGASGISLLQDRDNVFFQLEYAL